MRVCEGDKMYDELSVCVNDVEQHPETVVAAFKFAAANQANVRTVYVRPEIAELVGWQGISPIDISQQMLADLEQREQRARQSVTELLKQAECVSTWHTIASSEQPFEHMLTCDLIFAAQPSLDHPSYPNNQHFLNNLILQSKRPVLMIPRGWKYQSDFTQNIVFGWNSSAEAMRAATDAMPLFKAAKSLTVLDIVGHVRAQNASNSINQFENYLERKGIEYRLEVGACAHKRDVPKTFLAHAEQAGAGLIVVGGYGHSRLRELIMGGMTNHLIAQATIPTMFSH